jgi:hypothetical protein
MMHCGWIGWRDRGGLDWRDRGGLDWRDRGGLDGEIVVDWIGEIVVDWMESSWWIGLVRSWGIGLERSWEKSGGSQFKWNSFVKMFLQADEFVRNSQRSIENPQSPGSRFANT